MKVPIDIDKLIVDHLDYLYRLAFRLTGCKQTAEDIVQDLFVNLKPRDVDINYIRNQKAWLGTVLYRTFVKHCRKEKRSPFYNATNINHHQESNSTQDYLLCDQPGPAELDASVRLQNMLIIALDKLNENYRIVVVMHDIEGYTLQELHEIMHVPVGTLKSRLHRARNKLHTILTKKQTVMHSAPSLEQWLAHEV